MKKVQTDLELVEGNVTGDGAKRESGERCGNPEAASAEVIAPLG